MVREVHRSLESALLAEEVEKLGGAELVPPLVGSRAEAQTQGKEEMLQGAAEDRGVHRNLCPHMHSHPPFIFTLGALTHVRIGQIRGRGGGCRASCLPPGCFRYRTYLGGGGQWGGWEGSKDTLKARLAS